MGNDAFIEDITKLLAKMSPEQKDEWILTRARLVSESEQQDFMMSLTGEKKITYMPTSEEIIEFCEKVYSGEIYVEFETHYYEFNSDGRYVDDWEVQYNDPFEAFDFLDRVFCGCHDLLLLGEYDLAANILDQVCRLEFQVEISEESEDSGGESIFTMAHAFWENMLTTEMRSVAYDWISALLVSEVEKENAIFAEKLVDILHMEMCKNVQLSNFTGLLSETLLNSIEKTLEEEKKEIAAKLEVVSNPTESWREWITLNHKKSRNGHLLLDLQKKCRNQENREKQLQTVSVLEASWKQIQELIQILRYEKYIDDQLEIEEVWEICEALIKRNGFAEEDWELRESILSDMIEHEYYDYYGCADPMMDLAKKLCITEDEILAFADMLSKKSFYKREAAELYRKHGRMEKFVQYLETHLDKTSKEYLELIECYCNDGREEEARQIARQGLDKCKDDLTELFVFLLLDARKHGNEKEYKRLYASAKRRQKANIVRINERLSATDFCIS